MDPLSGINGNGGLRPARPAAGVPAISGDNRPTTEGGVISGVGTPDTVRLSAAGQLLSQLQRLQEQGPAKFKEVMSSVATLLRDTSRELGDSPEGRLLADFAATFQQVAETGDLSLLQPRPAPENHPIPHLRYQQAQAAADQGVLDFLTDPVAGQGLVGALIARVTEVIVRGSLAAGERPEG